MREKAESDSTAVPQTGARNAKPTQFGQVVDRLLKLTKSASSSEGPGRSKSIGEKTVAQLVGVSAQQFSKWVRAKDAISKADVNRVAWAISALIDRTITVEEGGKLALNVVRMPAGRGDLDAILKELYIAAGYLPVDSDPTIYDEKWNQLTGIDDDTADDSSEEMNPVTKRKLSGPINRQRRIVVGIFEDLGLGFVRDILGRLEWSLGVQIIEKRLENWDGYSVNHLKPNRIHLYEPRLELPRRAFALQYTRPLPLLRCGINAIVNGQFLEYVRSGGTVKAVSPNDAIDTPKLEYLNKEIIDRLDFRFVPGNIGEFSEHLFNLRTHKHPDPHVPMYRPVIIPEASNQAPGIKDKGVQRKGFQDKNVSENTPPNLSVIESAKEVMRYRPESPGRLLEVPENRIPALVVGQYFCYKITKATKESYADPGAKERLTPRTILPLSKSLAPVPYAFAVPYTEPRLHYQVDRALQLIFEDFDFMTRIYMNELDKLGSEGAQILDPSIEMDEFGRITQDQDLVLRNLKQALRLVAMHKRQ